MNTNGIVIIGLGPGSPGLLTRQAWDLLNNLNEIYVRTRKHPTISGFPPELKVHSFDHYYEDGQSFEDVYGRIIEEVLELGQRQEGVVYAVPGHPFIAEATTREIARRAGEAGIPLEVIEGLSFLEPTLSALGVDPMPRTMLVDAFELVQGHVPTFPPDAPALIAQVYSKTMASEIKLILMEVYPDEHPVQLVHGAGTAHVQVEILPLYEIDRSRQIDLLTSLYVPALGPATSFEGFQEIVAHLRAPEGCPWDREQTHQSLRSGLLEETYEVLSALDVEDPDALREELGDLLLQIALQAQIANEYGEFRMSEVIFGIHTKLVRRHPHVFDDMKVDGVGTVLQNWEKLKAVERELKGNNNANLLDSIPKALPALVQANHYQDRAARVGFEWPELDNVLDKIKEEVEEVRRAGTQAERLHEIGDLFFALVNLARNLNIDSESALRQANSRFRMRFGYVESAAREQKRNVSELSLEQMLDLWQQAKQQGL